ncbi:cation diffusion facilitator family transporter [Nostoc sphaeroides]|uniref:CzcD, cobalt-zinc-cadmium efflux system protein n=1 Tax=Nostoc sphaeroides CCNUC1 TaxID=2653204 RepID=A0A5P8W478_9NOSO|nr:cation diffusion facilitator family transporter [Nostoc sphaeroides]QFS46809.1 czcD, cobalt-zinc-cadmium efflux system protein [Nostoc sphaeroides CCNUC1]
MVSLQWCGCTDNQVKVVNNYQKGKNLWITVGLLAVFFVAEWSVGLWSQSLSLQADAGHILSDITALCISLLASFLAKQPANKKATFGHQRIEVLAALVNGLGLVAIATFIILEAIQRWQHPAAILGIPMLAIAVLGLIINLLNITLLHPHTHDDLNLRGALLHVIADTVSSVGVIIAALVVHLWDWWWADVAISIFVAIFTGLSALPLVQESLKIFLEYAPESIDPLEVKISLKSFPGVVEVEKLHIWTISLDKVMLCANLTVECATIQERDRLLTKLETHIRKTFNIAEITLQLTSSIKPSALPIHPLFNQDLVFMLSARKNNSTLEHS